MTSGPTEGGHEACGRPESRMRPEGVYGGRKDSLSANTEARLKSAPWGRLQRLGQLATLPGNLLMKGENCWKMGAEIFFPT